MDLFIQQIIAGLATGSIYGSFALALVLIYRATEVVNFAQGEMAMFTTYISWALLNAGYSYWTAFGATVLVAFVGGLLIERVLIRPIEDSPMLTVVIATLALFLIFNASAVWIFTGVQKPFPSPFQGGPFVAGGIRIGRHTLGQIGVSLCMLGLIYAFFRWTRLGLAMRAAAENPASARVLGIRVGWMLALGWGLAAACGAVTGMMVAPVLFLEPNMMGSVQIYAFAAATLGGFTSPAGAVLGGLIVGVIENLLGTYVPFIGTELKFTTALVMIIVVLLVRPQGLFGMAAAKRV